jgi:8-oxo-dGTP diphosphatase/A/G-specific adenine glycosylase
MNNDNRRQAVVAIIQKSDRFLFVKRSDYIEAAKGYWCPISGRIEKDETQEETLKREVMEEVGLEVVAVRKICEIPSHDNLYFLHYWTTKIILGKARITSNEATDIKWVTLEEMKKLRPVFEEDIEVFESLWRKA